MNVSVQGLVRPTASDQPCPPISKRPQAPRSKPAGSGIRQQRWHLPAAMMGDPGLLQELPDIPALLPEGGGNREQSAAADGTVSRLVAKCSVSTTLIIS